MEHGGPINVFSSVTISDDDHPDQFLMEEAMVKKRAEENLFFLLCLMRVDLGCWHFSWFVFR